MLDKRDLPCGPLEPPDAEGTSGDVQRLLTLFAIARSRAGAVEPPVNFPLLDAYRRGELADPADRAVVDEAVKLWRSWATALMAREQRDLNFET